MLKRDLVTLQIPTASVPDRTSPPSGVKSGQVLWGPFGYPGPARGKPLAAGMRFWTLQRMDLWPIWRNQGHGVQ